MRKVVISNGKTTAKTPGSWIKNTKEEASLRHEGESSSSDSLDSDDNDDNDDKTGAKANTCYGFGDSANAGDGGGDSTGAGGFFRGMDAVPEPNRAIRNNWCFGKGKRILVKKNREKPEVGKK